MVTRLFCYGTLEFSCVMQRVTGRLFRCERGVLSAYARYLMRGERYPGIAPTAGAQVCGTIYHRIDVPTLRTLDRYETALYRRCKVQVRDERGCIVPAWTYVTDEPACLAEGEWDPALFERRYLAAYLREIDAVSISPLP